MRKLLLILLFVFTGCMSSKPKSTEPVEYKLLASLVSAQSQQTSDRYPSRHPLETLTFFKIQPGDVVVEALPGGGWYSQILAPYLGERGKLIGVDYAGDMWANFDFASPEFIQQRKKWPEEFSAKSTDWALDGFSLAPVEAYPFDAVPESLNGTVDKVLFIRALHNMARFDSEGGFLGNALNRSYELLKPGGLVGIVQHAVSETYSDEWADGSHGYLKKSAVVKSMEAVGFQLVAESSINENPLDKPGENDSVWRLPPTLRNETEEDKAKMMAIGESNRMTLLFKKPE